MDKRTVLNIAQEYLNSVSEKYVIEKAFLFGSFAINKEKRDSDIAIVFVNIPDFFTVQLDLMKLRRKIDLRIETHLFSIEDFNENNPLAFEIIKTGIELKIKSKTTQQSL